jgi:tight adherence protein C
MEFLLSGLIFGSVALLTFGLAGFALSRSKARDRLTRLADGSHVDIPTEFSPDGTAIEEPAGFLRKLLAGFARTSAKRGDEVDRTRTRLIQAGYRQPSALTSYQGSRLLLALAFPLALIALSPLFAIDQMRVVALACCGSAVGLILPSMIIDYKGSKRSGAIIRGLPDALDLMVVCVEAGLGIGASLNRIAKEFRKSNPILSAEFELVTLEARAGKTNAAALRSLADRTGVSEISSLVAMLVQTERFGTSLADTLRVHSDDLRVQRFQRAEELAQKIPLKMLFPTVIIFVASMIVTIGPGMLQLSQFFTKAGE